MKTAMDAAGRLVIPRKIRERAGLVPGAPLTVRYAAGRVEIEPAPMPVELVQRGRLLVAVPRKPGPALTTAEVEEARRGIREDRERA